MRIKTFKQGGVKLKNNKAKTENLPIELMQDPDFVVIPLSQHFGEPAKPVVKKGDFVKIGQIIGEAVGNRSANIHSSVSGEVIEVANFPHPVLLEDTAIKIKNDKKSEWFIGQNSKKNSLLFERDEIIQTIFNNGIVGLGGAAFPTHIKLSPPPSANVDTLIINGAECEPYLTCDYRLMIENTKQILEGIQIILKIIPFKKVFIGIEQHNIEAIHIIESSLLQTKTDIPIKVVALKEKYPQGAEKNLIYAITRKVVPLYKLPFDIGIVVHNVGTVFSIYESYILNKPLIEKVITISGDCIAFPKNLKVKIGTMLKDIINECGGFTKEPEKIIFGGPMMGISQRNMEVPVIKGTSGILCFEHDQSVNSQNCIRCGKCIQNCPSGLMPLKIVEYYKAEDFNAYQDFYPLACIECGICSFVCPAKINLLNHIKLAKYEIQKRSVKK